MLKSAARKALWVTKGMALFGGAVVTLALVLGVGSVALAAAPGDPFRLGQVNAVNAMTRLAGSTNNAMLRLTNTSAGPSATALDLQVAPGKPPMRVNSDGRVVNLNTDRLDGKDSTAFLSGKIYQKTDQVSGNGQGGIRQAFVECDPGDVLLGGGGSGGTEDDLFQSEPRIDATSWEVVIQDNGVASPITATAICADFPPLR